MRRISISERSAKDLLIMVERHFPLGGRVADELRRALAPKKRKPVNARKVAKKAAKKEQRASVREQVMERAELCECGCGRPFGYVSSRPTLDHFFGKARSESVETCWALRLDCHRAKTDNNPSAAVWIEKFLNHCARHGYGDAYLKAEALLAKHEAKAEFAKRLNPDAGHGAADGFGGSDFP